MERAYPTKKSPKDLGSQTNPLVSPCQPWSFKDISSPNRSGLFPRSLELLRADLLATISSAPRLIKIVCEGWGSKSFSAFFGGHKSNTLGSYGRSTNINHLDHDVSHHGLEWHDWPRSWKVDFYQKNMATRVHQQFPTKPGATRGCKTDAFRGLISCITINYLYEIS